MAAPRPVAEHGWHLVQFVGRTCAAALPAPVREGLVDLLDRVYASGKAFVAGGYAMPYRGRSMAQPGQSFFKFNMPAPGVALPVAWTGYGQSGDRERSIAAGFDHHFVKPVHVDELVRQAERVPASPR